MYTVFVNKQQSQKYFHIILHLNNLHFRIDISMTGVTNIINIILIHFKYLFVTHTYLLYRYTIINLENDKIRVS